MTNVALLLAVYEPLFRFWDLQEPPVNTVWHAKVQSVLVCSIIPFSELSFSSNTETGLGAGFVKGHVVRYTQLFCLFLFKSQYNGIQIITNIRFR